MKIKLLSSMVAIAPIIIMLAVTALSFTIHAMAAESDAPEPGDCPDPTDPLCPPATSGNQTGNTTAPSSSAASPSTNTTSPAAK